MTLKQIWCGVTTGHSFSGAADCMPPNLVILDCAGCGQRVRGRLTEVIKPERFSENAGTVRHVLGPIPVETQRFDDKVLPPGKRIMRGGKLIGIVTPKTTEHPNKAHAATRKRGPNGQFLPGRFTDKRMKAWRKRIRKRAASKKK